jgi:hypothetical protein
VLQSIFLAPTSSANFSVIFQLAISANTELLSSTENKFEFLSIIDTASSKLT